MKYELSNYNGYDLCNLPKDSIKELEEYSYRAACEGSVLLENKTMSFPLKRASACLFSAEFKGNIIRVAQAQAAW